MSGQPTAPPPGWYRAQGDPPGTHRYWNGQGWQGEPRPVPGLGASDTFPMANLRRRALARLIDLVIWSIPALIVGGGSIPRRGLAALTIGILVVVYEAAMVGLRGATLGKMALGLSVIDVNGLATDLMAGVRRAAVLAGVLALWFTPYLWVLAPVVGLLLLLGGVLMIYAEDRRQTPWDKVGRTLVVTS